MRAHPASLLIDTFNIQDGRGLLKDNAVVAKVEGFLSQMGPLNALAAQKRAALLAQQVCKI